MNDNKKPEFWETAFIERGEMWGLEPCNSARLAKDYFVQRLVKTVLIPGVGYGRNAQPFIESGMNVTGIEISQTAIDMNRKLYGSSMKIYHGSVCDMPFDDKVYDGIFCHALIHLLDESEREKLISDCFSQLGEGGCMVFSAISKQAETYGTGKFISKDRWEIFEGVKMYFYGRDSITAEFTKAGLVEIIDINEGSPFFLIKCLKTIEKS
jgi:SAM-dependent methyltransferase